MIISYLFFGYKSEHALIEPAEKLRERKREDRKTPSRTDSVLIKFSQEFDICGVFELFSMKIKLESAQNQL